MNNYTVNIRSDNYGERYIDSFSSLQEAEQYIDYATQDENMKIVIESRFENLHPYHMQNYLSEFNFNIEINN